MKKIVLCLWLFSVVSSQAVTLGVVKPGKIDVDFKLVDTPTPTPTPKKTILKITPRVIVPITLKPIATATPTITPTATLTPSPTITPTATLTPSPTGKADNVGNQNLTNIFLLVTVGLLALILLVQNWPRSEKSDEGNNDEEN